MQIFEVFGDLIFRDPNVRERLHQISQAVDNAQQRFSMLGMNMQQFGQNMMNMGKGLIDNVTKPIGNMILEGVKYNSTLEDQLTSFETMLGSAAKAKTFMSDITKMAANTPFETSNLTEASKTLLGFGVNSQKVIPLMSRLGDFSLGNEQKFKSLSLVMGQVSAGTKLEGGDLLRFINAGWNPLQEMVKMTGKSYKELRKEMEKGNISFDEVSKALEHATNKGGMFYQGMIKGSQTLSGRISTLKDNFIILLGNATKPLFDFISQKAIPVISNLISKFDTLPTPLKVVIGLFLGFASGVGPLMVLLGGLVSIVGAVVAAIGAIGAPVVAVVGVLLGWIAVIGTVLASITALAAKTGLLQLVFSKVKAIVDAVIQVFKGNFTNAMEIMKNKFGMSQKEAAKFVLKMIDVKETIKTVIGVVKNVTALLGSIFTGNSQKMIDLLRNKFGYTKDEAIAFSKKLKELRDKVLQLGGQFKDVAAGALVRFMSGIKKAGEFIYDHRKQIAQAIDIFIKFSSTVVSVVNKVVSAIRKIASTAGSVFKEVKNHINLVVKSFNLLIGLIGRVVSKITGIKFPSPPDWFPKFAKGVKNFGGGIAIVGEQGPEVVELPKGS